MSSIMEKQVDHVNQSGFAPDGDVLEAMPPATNVAKRAATTNACCSSTSPRVATTWQPVAA